MMPRAARGQALVEFAFAAPLFVAFVFVIIQIALIFIAYYSTAEIALRGARWLAIHPQSTDAQYGAYLETQLLPGMVGGAPSQVTAGTSANRSISPPDPGTPAEVRLGALTVRYTACGQSGGFCTNVDRSPGSVLFVETRYDVSNWVFLPTTYNFGLFTFTLPTSLPTYRVNKMVE